MNSPPESSWGPGDKKGPSVEEVFTFRLRKVLGEKGDGENTEDRTLPSSLSFYVRDGNNYQSIQSNGTVLVISLNGII